MSDFSQALSEAFSSQKWIDRYAKSFQKAVNGFFENGGPIRQKAADFLNGTWIGHPLHPILTDIPIGSWTAAVVLDMMEENSGRKGVGKAADAAVALGVAGAAGAAVSGVADWQHLTGESRRTGFLHAALNATALALFVGSMIARKNRSRGTGRNLALVGFGIASVSAYLGGDLVFRQKIGVNHAPDDVVREDFTAVFPADQLPENTLTRAWLDSTALVLLRRGERVYALAETCAHLGGPLAEGSLEETEDGAPVVVCPWHRSRFAMDTGDLVNGPSAFPQPCFEARIADGMVEVRRNKEA